MVHKYIGDWLNRWSGFSFPHFFFLMNKNLRLKLVFGMMFSNKELLKAIAMFLLIRKRLGGNVIKDYSINKLVNITGAHARTIKKRMHVLLSYGLVTIVNRTLTLRSVVSKHAKRNVRLGDKMDYTSLKSVEYSLQAILLVQIQLRKDFAKQTIRNAHGASHDFKVVKAARDAARKFGYGFEYIERGLSYRTIAKKIGVSIKSAVEIVKFAAKRTFLKKITHSIPTYLPSVCGMEVYGYTFTTRNYGYKVLANCYSVAPSLALSMV